MIVVPIVIALPSPRQWTWKTVGVQCTQTAMVQRELRCIYGYDLFGMLHPFIGSAVSYHDTVHEAMA